MRANICSGTTLHEPLCFYLTNNQYPNWWKLKRDASGNVFVLTQSECSGLVVPLRRGARRAVVATPPTVEVRNALAPCRAFAQLFALFEVQAFPWRTRHIFLTGARVALGIGTGL